MLNFASPEPVRMTVNSARLEMSDVISSSGPVRTKVREQRMSGWQRRLFVVISTLTVSRRKLGSERRSSTPTRSGPLDLPLHGCLIADDAIAERQLQEVFRQSTSPMLTDHLAPSVPAIDTFK